MNFSAALGFPFRGKNAWPNIGLLLVCFLIPIVGPIVMIGFLIGVEKILIHNIQADAPRFDFGKFSPYLSRGVYPFLASLVLSLILMALLIPVVILIGVGFVLAQNNVAAIVGLVVLSFVLYFVLIAVFSAVGQPMMFKAGLEGSFQAAFDRLFVFDYLKRVGWLSVGVYFVSMLMAFPLMLFMCIPIVGPYAAMAVFMQVQAHLNTQLYLVYLERGGTALLILPDSPADPGFPVLPGSNPPTKP